MKRMKLFAALLLAVLLVGVPTLALAWTPKPVAQDYLPFMPGSQPGDSGTASGPDRCDNCHGGYDAAVEPGGNWRGSMMAQSFRDPIFLATLTVANQDSIWALGNPNAADICIRCHSPSGWLEGRSDPTNATTLSGVDFDGVQCDYCHRSMDMLAQNDQRFASNGSPDVPEETDPLIAAMAAQTKAADLAYLSTLTLFDLQNFLNPTNLPTYYGPFPKYQEAGAGQHFNDSANIMRGPFHDAVARHQMYYSRWHKSKEFCHDCHDVSNPILANLTMAADYTDNAGNGNASSQLAAASYFHVERTFSEFLNGEIGRAASKVPVNIPGVAGGANKCQDCHMRDITGKGCNKADAPLRTDLPMHDMTGGNSWLAGILASADPNNVALYDPYNNAILSGAKYPGAKIDMSGIIGWGTKLKAGSDRAIQQIQYGSTLTQQSDAGGQVVLRIQNNSAHKLISGYPEGRRLFLNVKWYDINGNVISEINPYAPLVTGKDGAGNDTYVSGGDITAKTEELVFEAEMSSSISKETTPYTFHFALATGRYKDNRIPPRGFDTAKMVERKIEPVWMGASAPNLFTAAEYAGGYKDVTLTKPQGAAGYLATLYYQTTSKKYMEFLRDEVNGTGKTTLTGLGAGGDPAYIAQTDPFFATLKDWGRAMWDLWLHNGGSAPVVMQQLDKKPTTTTPPPMLNPPTNLTATAGKGSVALKWTAPTNGTTPTGYKIYLLSAGKYTYIGSSTTTSWTHTKQRAGTTFTYTVTATATSGGVTYESTYSNTATATVR